MKNIIALFLCLTLIFNFADVSYANTYQYDIFVKSTTEV